MEPKIIKNSTDWDTLKKKLHLEEIISFLPCGSYFKNLEGNYIFCNSHLAKEAQLPSPEEIIHRTDYDMPWHIKAKQIIQEDIVAIKSNEAIETRIGDYFLQRQMVHDEQNRPIALWGMYYHKSQLSQFYYELEEIISVLPGHVYWKDRNYILQGCNDLQAKDVGLRSREDIVGKSAYDLIWKNQPEQDKREQAQITDTIDEEIMSTDIPRAVEEFAVLPNGSKAYYWSTKVPLHDQQGKVNGMVGVSIDITDRKKVEEELRNAKLLAETASQAKTEFLANMRHDIRTPLSGIIGFSELLKSESTEPRIKEYAENLVASSHALLALMDEVLEAVRVSSGEIPLVKRKFNLTQTLEHVIALYQACAQEKRLKLSLSLDKDLPHFVIGDKIRLHRIVLELIGNALNFTDVGHVTINAVLAKKENRQVVIKLTVTDSGMGIPKERQQDIYLQFKRLTPSYQGIYKGAGLGLYVVKQFIDELGGEIYVSSEPHVGTCFTCLIPFQESLLDDNSGIDEDRDFISEQTYMTPVNHQSDTPSDAIKNEEASAHILVVEDNLIAQTVAKALLTGMDCKVDIASNGNEAIEKCANNHYDLIFMDIGLGAGMDGYEVSYHIRNLEDKNNHTPIIALTAHAGDENKKRCIEAGMDAVLTKPLTQSHTTDILKSFIFVKQDETSVTTPLPVRRDLPDKDDELFQLEQFALLDHQEALKNCGNNKAMLMEMLSLMINQEVPKDLEQLKDAYAAKNNPIVEKLAHKIKGGAVYVGTTRMKYACQYVERYWKTGERALFDKLVHQAIHTIEDTCTYIIQWLEEQRSL